MPKNNKKDKKSVNLFFILGILLIVIGVAIQVHYLVVPALKYRHYSDKINDMAIINVDDNRKIKVKDDDIEIDFVSLKKTNPDAIGWITVDGTDISYPIVQEQSENEDYYLRHGYFGEISSHGAIFIEKECDSDFSDFMTVLYGHNMRDGSMFAGLHRFEEESFFEKNGKIHIYVPGEKKTYIVVGVCSAGTENRLAAYGYFQEDGLKEAFLNELQEKSIYNRRNTELLDTSHYITLSTCADYSNRKRFLVTAIEDAP